MPTIENGIYKIQNVKFSNYVADFTDGPPGPIYVWEKHPDNRNDRWCIRNVGDSNQVTIESVSYSGNYATVQSGSSLVGNKQPTVWSLVQLGPTNTGPFYIQTPNGQLVWQLPKGANRQEIFLEAHSGQDDEKWTFDKVGSC
ncbi:hypothetical protein HD554DRAFT_2178305 [Boletus coccyginus]|nr:hypothetical protein HD554DRAFT_2178305 [Boletus coccyginus]